jgi:hypothetical protein
MSRCSFVATAALAAAAIVTISLPTSALAATQIGPGNVGSTTNDTNAQLEIFDLTHTVTLAAGTYTVASLDTDFTLTGAGVLTPFLAADAGGTFTPLAVGANITNFTAGGGFQSYAFGGADTFTLAQSTLVVAGLEWTQGTTNMPVGFNAVGSTFAFYNGANTPVVGTPLAAVSGAGTFERTYDFSLTLAGVPEPTTWAMMLVGIGGLGGVMRRRAAPRAAA